MKKKNYIFKFKQFDIRQEKSAMKVCTDSCILGALAKPGYAQNILDIGTGTGLLSLMLAQKSMGDITAVEIDDAAAEESGLNFINSPWKERISLVHQPFQDFVSNAQYQFDFIISNPPFFKDNLPSGNVKKDMAMHSSALSLEELALGVGKLLSVTGEFVFMLPEYESGVLKQLLEVENIYPRRTSIVREKSDKTILRHVVTCSRNLISGPALENTIVIRNNDGSYSDQFKKLLRDYYLIF